MIKIFRFEVLQLKIHFLKSMFKIFINCASAMKLKICRTWSRNENIVTRFLIHNEIYVYYILVSNKNNYICI